MPYAGPLGGHFGRTMTGSLVRRLAFWVGQDVDSDALVRPSDLSAHQGRTRRPSGSHPPAAPPDTPRRDDRGGLDRRLADDGCGIRHDPESRGPFLG